MSRSQCSGVIWLKIPTRPVVNGGAELAVPSAPWRTMRGSLPCAGEALTGASGEGTTSMRQQPCVRGCMSPCVLGGIGKSGGISMYWMGSSVCASTHSWISWASHGGIVSGVAVGVSWAALSVYVVLLVAVASWVVGLLCGSGLVCWWAVLLAVWSSAGLVVGVARSTSGSELELRGWVLLGGVCSEVLLTPALSSPRTVWSVAAVGVWPAGSGCCCRAGGSSMLGLAAVVSAEGRLLPYVPHGRVWRFKRSFQSTGFDSVGGCRGCEWSACADPSRSRVRLYRIPHPGPSWSWGGGLGRRCWRLACFHSYLQALFWTLWLPWPSREHVGVSSSGFVEVSSSSMSTSSSAVPVSWAVVVASRSWLVRSMLRGAVWWGSVAMVLAVVGSQGLALAGLGLVSILCFGSGFAAVVCPVGVVRPPGGLSSAMLVGSAAAVAACGVGGGLSVLGSVSA